MNFANAAADMDSQYFSRNVRYTMLKERVVLVDRNSPSMITMDEWPQLVYLSADGEHTVSQFIALMSKQYSNGMPPGLAEQIHKITQDLVARGYVELSPKKKPLPYYLSVPVEQQDKVKAKALMQADGFIKSDSPK